MNKSIIELKGLVEGMNQIEKLVIKTYQQDDMGNHNHAFFELAYITSGSCVHTLNGISCKISAGDYYFIDYGSVHSYAKSNNLTLINCLFLPEIIDDTLKGCCSFEALMHGCLLRYYKVYLGKTPANRIFHDTDKRILHLLLGMMKEYQDKAIGYTELYRCKLVLPHFFVLPISPIHKLS